MITVDVLNLSDADLQTCVEEFVKRAVRNVRSKGISLHGETPKTKHMLSFQ